MPSAGEVIAGASGAKGKMLFYAGIVLVFGVLLNAGKWIHPEEGRSGTPRTSLRSDWNQNSRAMFAAQEKSQTWGDAAIRLGGSFMVAMVAASLLRVFFKTALTVVMLVVAVSWFLEYRGIIEPFWHDYYSSLGNARNWAVSQTHTAKEFLKGYVPSATAALIGFGFGLRR